MTRSLHGWTCSSSGRSAERQSEARRKTSRRGEAVFPLLTAGDIRCLVVVVVAVIVLHVLTFSVCKHSVTPSKVLTPQFCGS